MVAAGRVACASAVDVSSISPFKMVDCQFDGDLKEMGGE